MMNTVFMPLQTATTAILTQLAEVVDQLDAEDYASSLTVLSNNTIGKHVRHVLEFYELLLDSQATGQLNYDHRQRDLRLETSPEEALRRMTRIEAAIQSLDPDRPLLVAADLGGGSVQIPSSCARELLYNLEHAIHHMALIQVAVRHSFRHVTLPPHFGVAFSTVQHQGH